MYSVALFLKTVMRPAWLCWIGTDGHRWLLGVTGDPRQAARFDSHDEALEEAARFLRNENLPCTVTHLEAVLCPQQN